MKLKSSIKIRCPKCNVFYRFRKLVLTCTNLKHKRKQK